MATNNLTFDKRFNAQRGARRALKDKKAQEGIDFNTSKGADGKWTFSIPVNSPALAQHPTAKANAESWPTGPRRRKPAAPSKEAIKQAADRAEASADAKGGKKPKVPAAITPPRVTKKYGDMLEAASRGDLPPVPDLSAETHKTYRSCLRKIIDMVERRDLEALMAHTFRSGAKEPSCSSARLVTRYRNMCIQALKIRQSQGRLESKVSQVDWERALIDKATGFIVRSFKFGEHCNGHDDKPVAKISDIPEAVINAGPFASAFAVLPDGRHLRISKVTRRKKFLPTETLAAILAA